MCSLLFCSSQSDPEPVTSSCLSRSSFVFSCYHLQHSESFHHDVLRAGLRPALFRYHRFPGDNAVYAMRCDAMMFFATPYPKLFQICNFYEIRKISEDLVKSRKKFIKIGKKNDAFKLKIAKFASSGEKK